MFKDSTKRKGSTLFAGMVVIQCRLPRYPNPSHAYAQVLLLIMIKRPYTDSNCALRLRRPTLCPLSYRGGRQEEHLHLRQNFIIFTFLSLRVSEANVAISKWMRDCFVATNAPRNDEQLCSCSRG